MLEIQNVSKTFNAGTVNEKTALNGLNLKLNEGDFVTVIGGNGAGKSTMLNAVAGVWPVDCGKIIIDGVDVTRLGEHQRAAYIGRVFQDPMTGRADISQSLRPKRQTRRAQTMLEIQNVSKTFNAGTVNEKTALNGLNLKLNEGDFVTVIGGNGAGKSTMLNAVAGVWPVDCGKIIIDGVDVTRLGEHQRAAYIGRVFQDPMTGTAATMQIEENLALAARRGKPRTLRIGITRAEREQYRELLKSLDLGLENRLTARVGLLSGGQRQALTLLMATMNKPKLLLLDEHTAALDPKTALKVLTLSAKIVEENHLTTMMITHNMKDAIKYGNRLIMMHEGHIIYDVSGDEKKNLQVSDLLAKFQIASGGEFANDRMILS